MMCHKIGFSPISIIGLGFKCDSSEILVPKPPANFTTFMINLIFFRNKSPGKAEPLLEFFRRFIKYNNSAVNNYCIWGKYLLNQ